MEALVARTLAELGRVDVLVTAAGVAAFAPVADSKPDDWDEMLAVNLRGAVLCCRAVLPAMIAQRRGTIINVGSMVTEPDARRAAPPTPRRSTGCSASAGCWPRRCGPTGVRVGVLVGRRRRHPALGRHARRRRTGRACSARTRWREPPC